MTDLTTLQFHIGGLFDSKPVGDEVHLVGPSLTGGHGPILCGIDRHAKNAPGWSIGGGISGPGITMRPCPRCDSRREPDDTIRGLHSEVFDFAGREGGGEG